MCNSKAQHTVEEGVGLGLLDLKIFCFALGLWCVMCEMAQLSYSPTNKEETKV